MIVDDAGDDMAVVAQASDGQEALATLRRVTADIVLTFDPWTFTAYGPAVTAAGLLVLLFAAMREPHDTSAGTPPNTAKLTTQ